MKRPSGYDEAQSQTFSGEFERPPAGPYIFGITGAKEKVSSKGNPMLELWLDIAEGEFKNHFRNMGNRLDKTCFLRYYQLTEGDNLSYFKGMIKAIEESNEGFVFDFDESTLLHKKVGGSLREEEYENPSNGKRGMSLKIVFLCSIQKIRDNVLTPLKPKYLDSNEIKSDPSEINLEDDGLPF